MLLPQSSAWPAPRPTLSRSRPVGGRRDQRLSRGSSGIRIECSADTQACPYGQGPAFPRNHAKATAADSEEALRRARVPPRGRRPRTVHRMARRDTASMDRCLLKSLQRHFVLCNNMMSCPSWQWHRNGNPAFKLVSCSNPTGSALVV